MRRTNRRKNGKPRRQRLLKDGGGGLDLLVAAVVLRLVWFTPRAQTRARQNSWRGSPPASSSGSCLSMLLPRRNFPKTRCKTFSETLPRHLALRQLSFQTS